MDKPLDQRCAERFPSDLPVRVVLLDPAGERQLADCRLRDISTMGCGLTAAGDQPGPEAGCPIRVELLEPPLELPGHVVRKTARLPDGRLNIGVLFHELDWQHRTTLDRIIEQHTPEMEPDTAWVEREIWRRRCLSGLVVLGALLAGLLLVVIYKNWPEPEPEPAAKSAASDQPQLDPQKLRELLKK